MYKRQIVAGEYEEEPFGLSRRGRRSEVRLSSEVLLSMYDHAPGLASDKLKHVLETAAEHVKATGKRGLVFAYDEAQNLADHAAKDQFRLSLLLDVFQSIQRKGVPAMLVLTGLPTLMPQLVAARTYTERMFRVVTLERLSEADSHEAVTRPLRGKRVKFDETTVSRIVAESAGYPYFIQFICRELMDLFLQGALSVRKPFLPMTEIMKKLDADFFAGRWAAATDRQRELLLLVAGLETVESEFTVKQIVVAARKAAKRTFSASHVVQMLSALADIGLAYKNRHGRYSLAVPLLNRFIVRQFEGDATARTEKKLAGPKARRVVRRTKKRRVGSRSGRG